MVSRMFDRRLPEARSRVDIRYGLDSTLIVIPSPHSSFAIVQELILALIFVPLLALTVYAGLRGFVTEILLAGAPVDEVIISLVLGVVWMAFSVMLTIGILYGVLWRLWGEERIHISFDRLTIEVRAGVLRRRHSFALSQIVSVRSKLWVDQRHFPGDPGPALPSQTVNWFSWSDMGLLLIYEPSKGGKPKRISFGRELTMHEQSEILVEIDKYRFPEIHWGAGRG